MPWKESCAMTERMKFVGRLLDGERMSDLCVEYGISRKTGYKIYNRFQAEGFAGLKDQSRATRHHPNQTSRAVELAILDARAQHPTWGAPKIKRFLERKSPANKIPAKSTIHAILERHNLVLLKVRRAKSYSSIGTDLTKAQAPNKLWCTDFKGQFRLGNKKYCYPLTVTDQFSRYLLACEAFENTSEDQCIDAFHQIFSQFGIPDAIRSDNGVPFAARSYFGVSKLSLFWLRLGIKLERIEPGHPEQNGCHERMHRTLKAETTKPPRQNLLSQQEHFDSFREVYNNDRPHQALEMMSPHDIYKPSKKIFCPDQEELIYPKHEHVIRVSNCGSIQLHDKFRVYIGVPFGGYNVGVTQFDDGLWHVDFMNYRLGYFDLEKQKIQIGINPFLQKSLY